MRRPFPLAISLLILASIATPRAELSAQDLSTLPWREIGPASFGGRIDDIEAVPGRTSTIFVGTAGGGVFRTTNNGTTWSPVFDRDGHSTSIGDIAIAPSDPQIVWVGTGEANNRQSTTWGDGIYRSLDGGDSWTHMGLAATQHIGRVAIHPRDPKIVFVAALGHLFGPNDERGVYRTTDGGASWKRVLTGDSVTGAVDVAIDPDGRTIYAAMYQRQRKGYGFIGGGPGSGIFRSRDGGDSWERLATGLPAGPTGRIGLAIAPSQPNTVYAIVENKAGGVFRSDDRGNTWRRQSSLNPRPMYYSQVRVDPAHPDRVWILGTNVHKSIDGGRTFTTDSTGDRIHVDHHALWIDPADGSHMLLGNDGGLYFTYDGARNWDFIDNLPIGQFYDIDVDDRDPYYVYGGTQDNGTWGVPVRTWNGVGITNADVINIAYGDGFFTVTDPADPRYIYANSQGGRAYRVHLATREERGIRPVPADPKETYRFNWSTPMVRSPHDPRTIFYGGNRLFRTRNGGESWDVISPDLTRNGDWKSIPIMGMVRDSTTLSRDDGVGDYGTITSISESPSTAGTILTGSDDGAVQLTTDGGAHWTNISSRFRIPGAALGEPRALVGTRCAHGVRLLRRALRRRSGAVHLPHDRRRDHVDADRGRPPGGALGQVARRVSRQSRCALRGDRVRAVRDRRWRAALDACGGHAPARARRRHRDSSAVQGPHPRHARAQHHRARRRRRSSTAGSRPPRWRRGTLPDPSSGGALRDPRPPHARSAQLPGAEPALWRADHLHAGSGIVPGRHHRTYHRDQRPGRDGAHARGAGNRRPASRRLGPASRPRARRDRCGRRVVRGPDRGVGPSRALHRHARGAGGRR